MRDLVSADVRLALDPERMYARLAGLTDRGGWRAALRGPAFTALLIGTLVPMAATGRVTIPDVALATLSWIFVPALQMLAGAIVIASAPRRTVSMPRALELLFAGHVPWSLWLLAAAALVLLTDLSRPILAGLALSTLVFAFWTAKIISAFCRTVLRTTTRGARLRTVAHQTIIWTTAGTYVCLVTGLWPRLLGAVGR